MRRTVGFLCLWLLATPSPALARHCWVPNIRPLDNQTVQGNMYAVSGKRCGIMMLRSPGPIYSTRVLTQASHGTASVVNNLIFYVSRAGYAGDDHFVYVKQGFDTLNRPTSRTVEVSVKVVDKL